MLYLDGVEEASPPDQPDHTVRQLGHVLPQQLPHPLRVLVQLLLYEHLETGNSHLAGQGVTPIGAAMLPRPDVIIIILLLFIIVYCLMLSMMLSSQSTADTGSTPPDRAFPSTTMSGLAPSYNCRAQVQVQVR